MSNNTITPEIKYFVQSLRRVLYLTQILEYELQVFADAKVTPAFMKVNAGNMRNSMSRFMKDCAIKGKPETWKLVKSDLSSDQLHDISLLLETMSDVKNVGDIVRVLQDCKAMA